MMKSMQVAVRGIHFHVEREGRGEPLVLLHGFTGSSQTWQPLLPFFAQYYQVIRIDLIGHGQSDSPADWRRYSPEEAVADLCQLFTNLGLGKVHLLGYSLGGRIALHLALYKPHLLRSLILESSSPGLKTLLEQKRRKVNDDTLADWIEVQGMEAFVARWTELPLFATQKALPIARQEAVRQSRLQNKTCGLANSLRGMGTGVQTSLWPYLSKLSLPVLLLAGDLDSKFDKIGQQMTTEIHGSCFRKIPEAGHMIHLEQPELFSKAVKDFLEERI